MELAHGLLLNEEALNTIPDNKKEIFIYEWLRFLHKVLKASQKSDIKEKQKKLVDQLQKQILTGPGPPTRSLIGQCLSTLYQVGDSYSIYDSVGKCNDIVKNKDDSPSYLPIRLAAIVSIGIMYENNGRMLGGLFPDTVQVLIRGLKNAESQTRAETMDALRSLLVGLGASASMCHRDIYKCAKTCLIDRSMFVRTSAAQCLEELVKESAFVYTNEFEPLIQQSIKALEGGTYKVRCAVARMLGCLIAGIRTVKIPAGKAKKPTIEDAMNLLSNGFLQAGSSSSARDLLKGSSSTSGTSVRKVRVGITEAYVEFVRELGTEWLEKSLAPFLTKVLDIAAQPKATSSHVEAVYSRQCVSFILRSTLGAMLGESQQQNAVRELCEIINQHLAVIDNLIGDGNNGNTSTINAVQANQHVLVCATQEIGSLMRSLGTSALPLIQEQQTSIITPILGVLLYPSQAARLSTAWCLRCIAFALPSQMSVLIDRCVERLQSLKASSEAMLGYSAVLSSLIGGTQDCSMGIPLSKATAVFDIAEVVLRSVGQNTRMSICRTQAAWLMIGSLMRMGPSFVSPLLPKLLQRWKSSFPRSMKDLDQEKQRGDSFTWQLTLESRSGALCAMRCFVSFCRKLLDEDVTKKLMVPLESAMAMMGKLPDIIAIHGQHLKPSAAMVRLRLYDILSLLSPGTYEGSFNALLRELVAEFTLTDNPANTTTSLLISQCHQDDGILLGFSHQETDQRLIENHLERVYVSGSGSLEHDPTAVYLETPEENVAPGPLPLGVSVIDSALLLFGSVFPHVAMKHRLQMLKHFDDCVRQAGKNTQRQEAIQINVFTALVCALKGLSDSRRHLGTSDIRNAATTLIMSALTSTDSVLRCAAGEAIGRMAQVTNDPTFVAKTAMLCFEKLKTARDVISRTGHSLALGSLHRYVGGMASGQHLRMSVGILLALSQDSNSPEVQVWALHGLSLIIDAFGPMFRSYVDSSLQVVLTLFLQVAPQQVKVYRCLGRCLSALIATLGPELQDNSLSISSARSSSLTSCFIMSLHNDAQVQSESVSCLQQLHMFAPRHVELANLVPRLCDYMSSWHLILRRSSLSCLRQLAQKEAAEVCDLALKSKKEDATAKRGVVISDTGLEGALFCLLDRETDQELLSDARDVLSHVNQALALDNLRFWVEICKSVLAASTDATLMKSVDHEQQEVIDDDNDDDDDGGIISSSADKKKIRKNLIPPRWPTRVFAVELMRRIIRMCRHSGASPTHFDLAAAKTFVRQGNKGDFLVLHLSDLVRMSFMAATDNSSQLRMAGLDALQDVIIYFKDVPEPEFQGSVILEQYQANVGAALRPAFLAVDAPHEVTVRACEVCSTWISSGVLSDLSDLKRVHSLLVSSLDKVAKGKRQVSVYSESAATMEKLAVLKAWAEVYISSVGDRSNTQTTKSSKVNILNLVEPHLKDLSHLWLKALRDQAILKLPSEFSSQLSQQDGAFFTIESKSSVQSHYDYAWPAIIHGLSLWFSLVGFVDDINSDHPDSAVQEKEREKNLHLVLGVCVEALCSPRISESLTVILSCLSSLDALLSSAWTRRKIGDDQIQGIEILNVLHRLLLTRDSHLSQVLVLSCVRNIVKASIEKLYGDKVDFEVDTSGEGGESGEIIAGKSTVYAVLEVCMCVLVRHMPAVNPAFRRSDLKQAITNKNITNDGAGLVRTAVNLLGEVINLCSPRGSLTVLPSILLLLVGVLREGMSRKITNQHSMTVITTSALQVLRSFLTSPFLRSDPHNEQWKILLQSTLASVLEFTNADLSEYDPNFLLTCISLFLINAPLLISSNSKLLLLIIDYFEKCFLSAQASVKVKCLTLLTPILRHPEPIISYSFIHRMAPLIVQQLASLKGEVSNEEAKLASECLGTLELLATLTDSQHKNDIVGMIVPLFIHRLHKNPSELSSHPRSSTQVAMHNDALQRLLQIGPKYPQAFKTAIASNINFKSVLEQALKQNQAQTKKVTPAQTLSTQRVTSQPKITLKMDFSNFGQK